MKGEDAFATDVIVRHVVEVETAGPAQEGPVDGG